MPEAGEELLSRGSKVRRVCFLFSALRRAMRSILLAFEGGIVAGVTGRCFAVRTDGVLLMRAQVEQELPENKSFCTREQELLKQKLLWGEINASAQPGQ